MPLINRTLNLAKKLSLYIFIAVFVATFSAGSVLAEGGYTWTKQNDIGQANWKSVASSADGSRLVASTADSMMGGSVYTSEDYGVTWTYQSGAGHHVFYSVTSSADGCKLAAAAGQNDFLYTSTDSDVTWVEQATAGGDGGQYWSSISSSADGSRLVAIGDDDESGEGVIYIAFNPSLVPTDPDPNSPGPIISPVG